MTCAECLEYRSKFVFSPDIIRCGWLDAKYQLTNLQYQNRVNLSHFGETSCHHFQKNEVSGTSGCLKASSEKKTTRNSVQRVNSAVTQCAPWPMVTLSPLLYYVFGGVSVWLCTHWFCHTEKKAIKQTNKQRNTAKTHCFLAKLLERPRGS